MKALLGLVVAAITVTQAIAATADVPVRSAEAAVKKARYVCRLEAPKRPGQWQVVIVKNAKFGDEWHVWYGSDRVEPTCGFYGAIVKADGSYTSCAVSVCKPETEKDHERFQRLRRSRLGP